MRFAGILAFVLNCEARRDAQRVLDALSIEPGAVVADIGAGGGFFAFAFARRVGEGGRVYAVDVDDDLLRRIENRARKRGIKNLAAITGGADGCALPAQSCHLMFLRHVFHHLPHATLYLKNSVACLKPGGHMAVIEQRPGEGNACRAHRGHGTHEAAIREAMEAAGLRRVESFDFLRGDSFTVYEKRTTV